ncbi:hypothetical protein PG997_010195 [Apiospora hydei]|uniref:Nephrocystin 3-like N-terminal domain-containing protein n=1 Tax=Apiospora hydei TaxID=1337664 RepID=A0ABR1VXF8_9PEZI
MASASSVTDTGLSVVFDPEIEPIVDIVFVHGIHGDPVRTWTATRSSASAHHQADVETMPKRQSLIQRLIRGKTKSSVSVAERSLSSQRAGSELASSCYWPKDLLPVDLPGARVLTWGYDAMVTKGFKSADQSSLFAHANNFMFALARMVVTSRPIIFLAHSLGGIIVKEMLAHCDNSENERHQNIVASTAAIMFFATPHRGSKDLASYGEVARKAASILLDANSALLDSLGLKTTDLERSQAAFPRLWRKHKFRVKTFQEATRLSAVNIGILNEKVVPDYSSRLDDPLEEAEVLPGDHRDIVRVTSSSDPKYKAIIGEIRLCGELPDCTRYQAQEKELICQPVQDPANLSSLAFNQMRFRENSINQPQRGTCTWLQSHHHFRSWSEDEQSTDNPGILWIGGKPGSGKSTLIKATAQDPRFRTLTVASYYFNARSTNKLDHSELGLYRSLIHQLVTKDTPYFRDRFFETCLGRIYNGIYSTKEREDWTVATLKSVLGKLLSDSTNLRTPSIFFIDALDECDDLQSRSILNHLYELVDMDVLRLCISGRSSSRLVPRKCLQIVMDDYNRDDIFTYVTKAFMESKISTDSRSVKLAEDITTKSRGVFLWAVLITNLALNEYESGENWDYIETRLSDVPPELSDLYERLLASIPETEEAFVAFQFFVWVLLLGPKAGDALMLLLMPYLQLFWLAS